MSFFGKKQKKPLLTLLLTAADGSETECALDDLPLKEEVVLGHSIQFFGDPAPCYIHRGAVCVRLLAELEEELEPLPSGEKLPLPEKFSRFVGANWVSLVKKQ